MSVLVISESENEGEQLLDNQLNNGDNTLPGDVIVDLSEAFSDDGEEIAPRLSDERANSPVSVVAERFLRAILDKVPLDRIEELHLFSPLRQGTVETGIAVVAARVEVAAVAETLRPLELALDNTPEAEVDEPVVEEPVAEVVEVSAYISTEDPTGVDDEVESSLEEAETVADELEDERGIDVENAVESERDEVEEGDLEEDVDNPEIDDSPYSDDIPPISVAAEASDVVAATGISDAIVVEEFAKPEAPVIRHTVYTARYRLIVKGPERGKWEIDVVDEADAPLLTVETVVRGVQRRAGEETATVRYDAGQLARALRLPIPGIA